jgi:hypothetical protein
MKWMTRTLVAWSNNGEFTGWYCKACGWTYPFPSFGDRTLELTIDAWNSYAAHNCKSQQEVVSTPENLLVDRRAG